MFSHVHFVIQVVFARVLCCDKQAPPPSNSRCRGTRAEGARIDIKFPSNAAGQGICDRARSLRETLGMLSCVSILRVCSLILVSLFLNLNVSLNVAILSSECTSKFEKYSKSSNKAFDEVNL